MPEITPRPLQYQEHQPESTANQDSQILHIKSGPNDFNKVKLSQGRVNDANSGKFIGFLRDVADRHHLLFLLRMKLLNVIRSIDKFTAKSTDDNLAWSQVSRMLKKVSNDGTSNVNAYSQFLVDKGVTGEIHRWEDLPIMTKKNYVEVYDKKDLHVGNKIPTDGQCDQSSGTTGEPTIWYRNFKECSETGRHLRHAMKASVDGPVTSINCFALGPWATGMTIHTSLSKGAMEVAIGPDLNKAFNFIKNQNDQAHNNKKILNLVVLGYPPFMQELGEKLVAEGIEIHPKIKLWAVGGGEPMSGARREAMLATKFMDVRSSYGASDLTINIAAQDPWDIKLENLCKENSTLSKRIFGRENPPSVFHYDPGSYKIEQAPYKDENGTKIDRLLFTQLKQVSCPKVRYDLGDEGGISKQKEVEKILKEFGIHEMPARTHELPMLYIYGRSENAVIFNGSKVTPEHLEEALFKTELNNQPLKSHVESYALNSCEDSTGKSKLRILLELKPEESKENFNAEEIKQQIVSLIRKRNEDFDKAVDFATDKNIEVLVFDHHQGPNFHPNPNTKKVYIFEGPIELRSGEKI